LSSFFVESSGATTQLTGNANQLNAAAGTYLLAVQNFSAAGLPIALHFSLTFKAMKQPRPATPAAAAATPASFTPVASTPGTPLSTGTPAINGQPASNASGSSLTYDRNGYTVDLDNDAVSGLVVNYTYYGDANSAGAADGSDYSLIDAGYSNQLNGWTNGDFNYDGAVDSSDYTLINNAFGTQGALPTSPSTSSNPQTATAIPELG
jgi:hypothetical protein